MRGDDDLRTYEKYLEYFDNPATRDPFENPSFMDCQDASEDEYCFQKSFVEQFDPDFNSAISGANFQPSDEEFEANTMLSSHSSSSTIKIRSFAHLLPFNRDLALRAHVTAGIQ